MIHLLLEMVKNRPIPGPLEETSPLYKNLVRRLRYRLKIANPKMDFNEVELAARRIAGWAEDLVNEVANRSLSNIQATKLNSINNDVEIDKLLSENSDRNKIFVDELPEGSNIESSFVKTGLKVQVNDSEGNKVTVESLVSGDIEKTLVTKENPEGKSKTWLLQQVTARNPLKKTENEIHEIEKNLTKILEKKKKSMTDEEWKQFVRTKILAPSTNLSKLEHSATKKEKLEHIKKILEPIFNSDGPKIDKYVPIIPNKSSERNNTINKEDTVHKKKYMKATSTVNTKVLY